MNILCAWKESLKFFRWNSIKSFLAVLQSVLPVVYKGWGQYCLWAYIIIGVIIPFAPSLIIKSYAQQQPLILVALFAVTISLLSYAATILFIVTYQALERKPLNPFAYDKHTTMFVMLMSIIFSALVYWFYTGMFPIIHNLTTASKTMPVVPFDAFVEHIKMFGYTALALFDAVTLTLFITFLFFIVSPPTLFGLLASMRSMLAFVFRHAPVLIILYGALTVLGLPAGICFNRFIEYAVRVHDADMILMTFFITWVVFFPLCVATYGCYFYKQIESTFLD